MAPTAMKEPMASVDSPVRPWPMVQPMAVTPPKPISTAPRSCWRRSSSEANPSRRNLPVASDHSAAPITTPTAVAMPKLRRSDLSVHIIRSSSE